MIRTIIDTGAQIIYAESLKFTDLSLAIPALSLTPVAIVGIEYLLTGDIPSNSGWLGISLIVFGMVWLYSGSQKEIGSKFKYIFTHKGGRLMILTAFLWSITTVLHRIAIGESNPIFYGGVSALFIFLGTSIVVFLRNGRKSFSLFPLAAKQGNGIPGILAAATWIFQVLAQSGTLASYAISVKRSSIVFSMFLGKRYLAESIKSRIIPIFIIFSGIILIAIDK